MTEHILSCSFDNIVFFSSGNKILKIELTVCVCLEWEIKMNTVHILNYDIKQRVVAL